MPAVPATNPAGPDAEAAHEAGQAPPPDPFRQRADGFGKRPIRRHPPGARHFRLHSKDQVSLARLWLRSRSDSQVRDVKRHRRKGSGPCLHHQASHRKPCGTGHVFIQNPRPCQPAFTGSTLGLVLAGDVEIQFRNLPDVIDRHLRKTGGEGGTRTPDPAIMSRML